MAIFFVRLRPPPLRRKARSAVPCAVQINADEVERACERAYAISHNVLTLAGQTQCSPQYRP